MSAAPDAACVSYVSDSTHGLAKNQSAPKPGANPYPLSGVYPMYRKPFKEAPFAMHFFHRFLETAREHKIPIHWVSMPALAVTNEARALEEAANALFATSKRAHAEQVVEAMLGLRDLSRLQVQQGVNAIQRAVA